MRGNDSSLWANSRANFVYVCFFRHFESSMRELGSHVTATTWFEGPACMYVSLQMIEIYVLKTFGRNHFPMELFWTVSLAFEWLR